LFEEITVDEENSREEQVSEGMSEDLLTLYMREARKFKMLDRDREVALIDRWRASGDAKALEQLVGSHQRLVVGIASEFGGYGLPLTDLISEGNIGLLRAIVKFDPDRGFRLSTYAMWWIKAQISEYVIRSSSLVRMVTNEHQKRLFFNLRRLRAKYHGPSEGELSADAVVAIARDLGVPESEIRVMDRRLGTADRSLNAPVVGDDSSGPEWQDLLVDDGCDPEAEMIEGDQLETRRALLHDALDQLSERERHIFTQRRLTEDPPKLSELSIRYGVSRERVRQIEAAAMAKVTEAIRQRNRQGAPTKREGPARHGRKGQIGVT
jgi:RNA polymerase sigma-32 factor